MRILLELDLPPDAGLLRRARQTVEGFLECLHIEEEDLHDVVLAFQEACANAIQHAELGPDGSFRVRAELSPEEAVIEVEDHGTGFRPEAVGPAELDALAGRGLQIIDDVMHDVAIDSTPGDGGTVVRMRRALH